MRGFTVLAIVLLVLFLLGQIKVGAGVEYSQTGLTVRVRLGPFRFTVFPPSHKKKKEKKPKKEKKKKKPKPKEQEKRPKGGVLELVKELLPVALDALGSFKRKLVVDKLELRMTAGAPDPADAAEMYGRANAALGALWYPLTEVLNVKDGRAHVEVDFDQPSITLYALAELSLRIWQILWLGVYFGIRALAGFLRYRRQQKTKRKAVS